MHFPSSVRLLYNEKKPLLKSYHLQGFVLYLYD